MKSIIISELLVNRSNDRHGELENETAAIAWLFNQKERHMKNLAQDIVSQGKIYEPPLVAERNNKFVVFDGNRRVTCWKLLHNPLRAPNSELQAYFRKLRDDWNGDLSDQLFFPS